MRLSGFLRLMDYSEAVKYLSSLGNEVLTAKLGLRNISTLLKLLGDPHRRFESILIAGTNGKGSVAAFCESILRSAGYRTGLYTSPHLVRVEERICVDGAKISPEEFSCLTGEVRDVVSFLLSQSRSRETDSWLRCHPTYFETVTAIAFKYFAERQIDVAVLEVGLGGRLDATNVVDPLVAVITNIDYDHQKYLGSTLEEIATEKAGIIKPRLGLTRYSRTRFRRPTDKPSDRLPVVLCHSSRTVTEVIESQCRATGSRLVRALEGMEYEARPDEQGYFRLHLKSGFCSGVEVSIPLPGEHQVANAITAVRIMECLELYNVAFDVMSIERGIAQTRWPGRLEILDLRPRIVLDGAHNRAGAEMVRRYIQSFLDPNRIVMIYSAMRDKPVKEMARNLFPLSRQVILPRLESERAANPLEIAALLPEFDSIIRCAKNVGEALCLAQQMAGRNDTIFVVGSLFLTGEVKKALGTRLFHIEDAVESVPAAHNSIGFSRL